MRRAVFLDKDGTLVIDVPYNVDPEQIILAPRAFDGCAALHRAGYLLVVVTNQSGIAKGLFKAQALIAVEARLRRLVGVPIAGFYYCPHDDADQCGCRKPRPGMIVQAARELSINLTESWMIGDILNDVEAGNRAGVRSILIDNGNETQWRWDMLRRPAHRVPDIGAAATAILYEAAVPA